MTGSGLAALLAGITVIRLVVAALMPLTPDEAYYWVWSRALAPGYLDHPPMVAVWIRLGTALAGSGPLGIRLLAPLSALLGSVLLRQAAIDLVGSGAGWRAVLLLNATLLFGVGAVTMTPDTPLLFFWTATVWAMGRLIATRRASWWWAAGAGVGLAMCSKYTAVLLPAGIALWLLVASGERQWLLRPQPWLSGVVAIGMFTPVMWWNAGHGWASFIKQGGRTGVFHPARLLSHLAELLAGQVGLATPLVFVLCAAGTAVAAGRAWRQRDSRCVLLACLTLPACAVFMEHVLGDRVQANWPAIIYPSAAVAACLLTGRRWRRLLIAGVGSGAVMTGFVYLQSTVAPLHLSRRLDPSLRLAGGYERLAGQVQAIAGKQGASFVAVDDYGPAALMAYFASGCSAVIAIEPRWTLFHLPSAQPWISGRTGLLLRSARRHDQPSTTDWIRLRPLQTVDRERNGRFAERYLLYVGVGRPGLDAAALLPCRNGRGAAGGMGAVGGLGFP